MEVRGEVKGVPKHACEGAQVNNLDEGVIRTRVRKKEREKRTVKFYDCVRFYGFALDFISIFGFIAKLTDLQLDAVVLLGPVNGLVHHICVLLLGERAGGIHDLPTWTSCFNARPAGWTP